VPDRLEAPRILADRYEDWIWEVAYAYEGHSLVYRLARDGAPVLFLKLAPTEHHPSLKDEAARMTWAAAHLPVPHVVERGEELGTSWLVTTALPGEDATSATWSGRREWLVRKLASGLRAFHRAPAAACPFDFRLESALALARRRLAAGLIDPRKDFHTEFAGLSAREAVERLEVDKPETESLVVCHGDYCAPNILIDGDGISGYLDLGELGVADEWWDLSVATWSVTWNFGAGYEELFLSEYGVAPDDIRMNYYRLLYDVVS
jgi:kanamycin kinase